MTESTVAVIALLVLGWAIVSGALARHDITGPFVFAVAGYLAGEPGLGTVDGRRRRHLGPRRRRGHPGPRAVLRRRQGEPGGAPARPRDPRAAARHRPRPLGGPRQRPRRLDPRRLPVGARRLRRCSTGSDRRRPQRGGDQRRAHPPAPSARAQRRERAQRRHRHADRRVHAGGGGQPTRHRRARACPSRREPRCASWAAGSSSASPSGSAARC